MEIPGPVIAEVARAFESKDTHAQLDNLFMSAGASGEPPPGSKLVKVGAWLRQINADPGVDPLAILGKLLEEFLEVSPPSDGPYFLKAWEQRRRRIHEALASRGLSYQTGGKILGGSLSAPSRSLADLIRARDLQRFMPSSSAPWRTWRATRRPLLPPHAPSWRLCAASTSPRRT